MVMVDFAERFEPAMRLEYLALRDRWFGLRRGIEAVGAPADRFDEDSILVLASAGRQHVGGARVRHHRPAHVSSNAGRSSNHGTADALWTS